MRARKLMDVQMTSSNGLKSVVSDYGTNVSDFDNKYSETFFHIEDDMAICSECKGKKFFVRTTGYWKYLHTKKGCSHSWRNASQEDVEEFTEVKLRSSSQG